MILEHEMDHVDVNVEVWRTERAFWFWSNVVDWIVLAG